jgi:hypothetical protein
VTGSDAASTSLPNPVINAPYDPPSQYFELDSVTGTPTGVLFPGYYRMRDLMPLDLWGSLGEAQIVIANYQQFIPKDRKEMKGVAANTRKILTHGKKVDPFKETSDEVVSRALRDFAGRGKNEIVVLNDEAHHCYQDKPADDGQATDKVAAERTPIRGCGSGARWRCSASFASRRSMTSRPRRSTCPALATRRTSCSRGCNVDVNTVTK